MCKIQFCHNFENTILHIYFFEIFRFVGRKKQFGHCRSLGKDGCTKSDEISEKSQTASDPDFPYVSKIRDINRQLDEYSAICHFEG